MMRNNQRKAKQEKKSKNVVNFKCTGCNDSGLIKKSDLKEPCGICGGSRITTK